MNYQAPDTTVLEDVFEFAETVRSYHQPLLDSQPSQRQPFTARQPHEVGLFRDVGRVLDRLPRELVLQVLPMLDLPLLSILRRKSHTAAAMIDTLHEYKTMTEYTPLVVTGAISINARSFSLSEMYNVLFGEMQCATCHRQGFLIYLITCRRVCYMCLQNRSEYTPVQLSTVMWSMNLSWRNLARVSRVLSIAGDYGGPSYKEYKRSILFDRGALSELASQSGQVIEPAFRRRRGREVSRELPISLESSLVTVWAPLLSVLPRGSVFCDWSVFCPCCIGDERWDKHTREGYIEHVKQERLHHGGRPLAAPLKDTTNMPYGLRTETKTDQMVAKYSKDIRSSRLYFGESVVHGPFEISKEVQLLEDKLRLRLPISSAVNGQQERQRHSSSTATSQVFDLTDIRQQERQRHSSSTATSQVFDLSDIILVIAGWISWAICCLKAIWFKGYDEKVDNKESYGIYANAYTA